MEIQFVVLWVHVLNNGQIVVNSDQLQLIYDLEIASVELRNYVLKVVMLAILYVQPVFFLKLLILFKDFWNLR